jgi:hypothetical protein
VAAVLVLPLYLAMVGRQAPRVGRAVASALWPVVLACAAAAIAARLVLTVVDVPFVQLVLGGAAGGLVYVACAWRLAAPYLQRGI